MFQKETIWNLENGDEPKWCLKCHMTKGDGMMSIRKILVHKILLESKGVMSTPLEEVL